MRDGQAARRSLLQAANFVATIQQRQGLKIACIEEIALRKGFISAREFEKAARSQDGACGRYLRELLAEPDSVTG